MNTNGLKTRKIEKSIMVVPPEVQQSSRIYFLELFLCSK